MGRHPHNHASQGCDSAHLPLNENTKATSYCSRQAAFNQQEGLGVQPSGHHNSPSCPPCYTQFAIVTCFCIFNRYLVCEGNKCSNSPSPDGCELEDTSHSPQLYRDFDCPLLRLALSPTGETVFPSWSSGLHIWADAGACKRHCCTRPHLGKRIFGAARQTLARFGLRQRRSVHFQSGSPTSTLVSEADSGMSWELPTKEIGLPSRELPAELPNEIYMPHEPLSAPESSVPTTNLSPPFACSRIPTQLQPMFQTSVSPSETSSSDAHCSKSSSQSDDPSNQKINEDLHEFFHELGNERDGADHSQYFSDNVDHGLTSKTAADRDLPTWEKNIPGGRADFRESPTSISNEVKLRKVGLKINTCAATGGAFAEPRVFTIGQASLSSNDYTLEPPADLSPHRQLCSGTSQYQPSDLELSSPSNQQSVSSGSSTSDRSVSLHDWHYPQALTQPFGPSLSELLEILDSESWELEGWVPSGLIRRVEIVFHSTTKQFLGKLSELKKPEFRAVLVPVHKIKPTLDIGLSALNSLVTGQVPNGLNEVISLLFVAYSIVTTLVNDRNKAQFTEALFLDDVEWTKAIYCREEQDAFKMLLQDVWLPAAISSVSTHVYPLPSCVSRSLRPAGTPVKRATISFEEGWLGGEKESGFRLRTGLNAQICQWYIDYIHRTASLGRRYPPATSSPGGPPFEELVRCDLIRHSAGEPPSFVDSVRCDLIRPYRKYSFPNKCNRALDILERELDKGQISTFDEVASLVNSQINSSEPELAFSAYIFSARCRGAQAMYDSRKVRWLLDQIRRSASPVVTARGGDTESSHSPLANTDTPRLHELSGVPYSSSQAVDPTTAPSTLPATSLTRKRKRRNSHKGPRRHTHDGEASLLTKCPHCKQTFSGALCDQKSNLNRHVEHKHGASTHVCPECCQGFPRSDYLLKHRRDIHNLH